MFFDEETRGMTPLTCALIEVFVAAYKKKSPML
jgi:hypothetical protein